MSTSALRGIAADIMERRREKIVDTPPQGATVEKTGGLVRDFSTVELTLDTVLLTEADRLRKTPSFEDGILEEDEAQLRSLGCEYIQTAGILLKLPQVAVATAQTLFQRFYFSKSFLKHPLDHCAMAAVHLASKIEEDTRRIRAVINVFHHLKQVRQQKPIKPMPIDQTYVNAKNQVIKAERRILKELGFCCHTKHIHKIILILFQQLGWQDNRRACQKAWNYMNDSLRTDCYVRFQPEVIACACIFLASRDYALPLPKWAAYHWYTVFNASDSEMQEITMALLKMYRRPRPDCDKLEAMLNELRRRQSELKKAEKAAAVEAADSAAKQAIAKTLQSALDYEEKDRRDKKPFKDNQKVKSRSRSPSRSHNRLSDSPGRVRSRSSSQQLVKKKKYMDLSHHNSSRDGKRREDKDRPREYPAAYAPVTTGAGTRRHNGRHRSDNGKHSTSRSRSRSPSYKSRKRGTSRSPDAYRNRKR